MFLFALFRTHLQRTRPRDEFGFGHSLFRWAFVLSASLAALAGVSAVLYAVASALGDSTPFVLLFRNLVRYASSQSWHAPTLQAACTGPVVLLVATGLTLYERTRSIDANPYSSRETIPSTS